MAGKLSVLFLGTAPDVDHYNRPIFFNTVYRLVDRAVANDADIRALDFNATRSLDTFFGDHITKRYIRDFLTGYAADSSNIDVYFVRIGYPEKQIKSATGASVQGAYEGEFNGTIHLHVAGNRYSMYFNNAGVFEYIDMAFMDDIAIREAGLTITPTSSDIAIDVVARRDPQNTTEHYYALEDAYLTLLGMEFDVVVPLETEADAEIDIIDVPDGSPDTNANFVSFAYQLARFCYLASSDFRFCVGFIGTSKPDHLDDISINRWVDKLLNYRLAQNGYYWTSSQTADGAVVYEDNVPIDIGRHIVIIPGDLMVGGSTTGRRAYPYLAGWMLNLVSDPRTFTFHRRLPNNYKVLENISKATRHLSLVDAGYSIVIQNNRLLQALTAARPASSFSALSTIMGIKKLFDALRKALKPYLGRPLSETVVSVVQTAAEITAANAVEAGYIEAAEVAVQPAGTADLERIDVFIKLKPLYEPRILKFSASVSE